MCTYATVTEPHQVSQKRNGKLSCILQEHTIFMHVYARWRARTHTQRMDANAKELTIDKDVAKKKRIWRVHRKSRNRNIHEQTTHNNNKPTQKSRHQRNEPQGAHARAHGKTKINHKTKSTAILMWIQKSRWNEEKIKTGNRVHKKNKYIHGMEDRDRDTWSE